MDKLRNRRKFLRKATTELLKQVEESSDVDTKLFFKQTAEKKEELKEVDKQIIDLMDADVDLSQEKAHTKFGYPVDSCYVKNNKVHLSMKFKIFNNMKLLLQIVRAINGVNLKKSD